MDNGRGRTRILLIGIVNYGSRLLFDNQEDISFMPSGRIFNFADREENYFAVMEKK